MQSVTIKEYCGASLASILSDTKGKKQAASMDSQDNHSDLDQDDMAYSPSFVAISDTFWTTMW